MYAEAGYTGVEKREEHENLNVIWQVAARHSTYSKLNKRGVLYKANRRCCITRTQGEPPLTPDAAMPRAQSQAFPDG